MIIYSCGHCGKIISFLSCTLMDDGSRLCTDCLNKLQYNQWMDKCRKRAEHLYTSSVRNIIIDFIDRYGVSPNDEEKNKFLRLLEKKYRIKFYEDELEDIPQILTFVKENYDEDNDLKKFENDLKYHKEKVFHCSICNKEISRRVFEYSIDIFDRALCRDHQNELRATLHAKKLYNELKKRNLSCKLEANDNHKTIDISIPPAKLYIEVDGKQHVTNPKQFIADMKRDNYSYKNGFVTKRIPNHLINEHLNEIVESIVLLVEERVKEINLKN